MKTRNYVEHEVVSQLNQKNDIFIPRDKKVMYELVCNAAKGDIGIMSRGKMSFLKKYCGYIHLKVTEEELRKKKR